MIDVIRTTKDRRRRTAGYLCGIAPDPLSLPETSTRPVLVFLPNGTMLPIRAALEQTISASATGGADQVTIMPGGTTIRVKRPHKFRPPAIHASGASVKHMLQDDDVATDPSAAALSWYPIPAGSYSSPVLESLDHVVPPPLVALSATSAPAAPSTLPGTWSPTGSSATDPSSEVETFASLFPPPWLPQLEGDEEFPSEFPNPTRPFSFFSLPSNSFMPRMETDYLLDEMILDSASSASS
jgi:hypothetical protein